MANPEHLKVVTLGKWSWNDWRDSHSVTTPDLSNANLHGANLAGMDLSGAVLTSADLRDVNFSAADLRYSSLKKAHLDRADFEGANLSGADLSDTDLREVNLRKADLQGANLEGVILKGVDFGTTHFGELTLREARLHGASMYGVQFDGVDLSYSDLSGASLSGADLSRANLTGANLEDAIVGGTIFGHNDLSTIRGLETVRHYGPSIIGIDTIYRSKAKIPENFLKGAGVPDDFVRYMGALVAQPFEFYSCFISYSSSDQQFAERLHADLQSRGVRCWFAPHDVKGGKKLHEQIDQAIRVHERLLLILSPDSMESEWVKTEIAKARKRELQEKRQVLFPLRLVPFKALRDWECFDADTGKDSAREIREYFIPDFSNWKSHDPYQEALGRLLRDLKNEKCTLAKSSSSS